MRLLINLISHKSTPLLVRGGVGAIKNYEKYY